MSAINESLMKTKKVLSFLKIAEAMRANQGYFCFVFFFWHPKPRHPKTARHSFLGLLCHYIFLVLNNTFLFKLINLAFYVTTGQ